MESGLIGPKRIGLSWAVGEWERGLRILLGYVSLDYRKGENYS